MLSAPEDIKQKQNERRTKVSVPCAEKCWSTPPSPPSLHAEKCVTLPLVRGPCDEKCWSTPPSPPSLHAEKCVTLLLVRGLGAEKC